MRKVERLPTLDCEADYVATLLERTRVQGENEDKMRKFEEKIW